MDKVIKISNPNYGKEKKWFEFLKLWGIGIGSYYVFTWIYDYLIITALLLYFGSLKGGCVALIISMIIDFLTLRFYDWIKKDWLALETIKELNNKNGFVGKLFRFVHNKGSVITVFVLSLFLNAFIVTTYLRNGSYEYNGLKKRDWIIFASSSIIGNGYWILMFAGGITIIKEFLKLIF